MASRDNILQVRVNDREKEYVEELSEQLGVSESEVVRVVLYDSRFLYSSGVSFGEIDISPNDLIPSEYSVTDGKESVERIFED